jgi:RNase adaptor protein for sRNA GlmZ degradation
MPTETLPLIKVVGVSASGKSTLVRGLRERGYDARSVSQEHSHVPDLWQRMRPPARLIYLDVSLDVQRSRRPDVTWDEAWRTEEVRRLAHAREHADLRIDTSAIPAEQTLALALVMLETQKIRKSAQPLPPAGTTGGPAPRDT